MPRLCVWAGRVSTGNGEMGEWVVGDGGLDIGEEDGVDGAFW